MDSRSVQAVLALYLRRSVVMLHLNVRDLNSIKLLVGQAFSRLAAMPYQQGLNDLNYCNVQLEIV